MRKEGNIEGSLFAKHQDGLRNRTNNKKKNHKVTTQGKVENLKRIYHSC